MTLAPRMKSQLWRLGAALRERGPDPDGRPECLEVDALALWHSDVAGEVAAIVGED